MKTINSIKLLFLTAIVTGGLLTSPLLGSRAHAQMIDGSVRYIKATINTSSTVATDPGEDNGEDDEADFADESSASPEDGQAVSRSDPEWRYVPVRR